MNDDRQSRLNQALAEIDEAVKAGQPLNRDALLAKYADIAEELEVHLRLAEKQVTEPNGPGEHSSGDSTASQRPSPTDTRAASQHDDASDAIEISIRPPFSGLSNDFEILGEIGRGGMGLVYRARQRSLQRDVALKFILLGCWAPPDEQRRFQLEARAAARLKHPHIVSVHEVGERDGHPYLVMEYVDGPSLKSVLKEGPFPPRKAARLIYHVADAVAEAHQQQIVHRDLKPSNILIDRQGLPRVTDFGLAKILNEQSDDLTMSGQVIGTPSYMAPEQADSRLPITPSTDIYALGAVLYEVLSGRPPFQTDNTAETLQLVISEEPPALRILVPTIPRDLETICLKCLSKEAPHRYESAGDLRDDLKRFLDGTPIHARPPHWTRRLWMWAKRNPSIAAACAVIAFFLVAVQGATSYHLSAVNQLNTELEERNELLNASLSTTDKLRLLERESARRSQQLAYASDMRLAMEAFRAGDSRQMQFLLASQIPESPDAFDVRGFAWRYLSGIKPKPLRELGNFDAACYYVTFTNDGKQCVTCGSDGHIRFFDIHTGNLIADWDSGQHEVNSVAFHPYENRLASAGDDGTVCVWDISSQERLHTIQVYDGVPAYGVAYSPDGKVVYACGQPNDIAILDIDREQVIDRLTGLHERSVEAIAVSSDGRLLASASSDHVLGLWNVETCQLLSNREEHPRRMSCVQFFPDGRHFVTGGIGGQVTIWDVENCTPVAKLYRPDGIQQVSTTALGTVAVGDRGGTVTVWQVLSPTGDLLASPQLLASWRADEERIYGLSFTPDGSSVVSSSRSGRVAQWPLKPTARVLRLGERVEPHRPWMNGLFAMPDGTIVTGSSNALVRWNIATRDESVLLETTGPVTTTSVSPDGKTILCAEHEGPLHLRRDDTKWRTFPVGSPEERLHQVLLMPGEKSALILTSERELLELDLDSERVTKRLEDINVFQISRKSKRAWVSEVGTNDLVAYQLADWTESVRINAHRDTLTNIVLSPDESHVATVSNDRQLAAWNTFTALAAWRIDSSVTNPWALTWSPDGRTLVVGDEEGRINLFQAETGRKLYTLTVDNEPLISLVFTTNGDWLVARNSHLQMYLFDGRPQE